MPDGPALLGRTASTASWAATTFGCKPAISGIERNSRLRCAFSTHGDTSATISSIIRCFSIA
ncbi:hypothetical protein WME94_44755 [Sorangium sp. So ce429]